MSDTSEGTGGLSFDKTKRQWPNEVNVFLALILIVVIFEILGAIFMGQSLLFDTRDRFDSIFNEARLRIIIIQVAIIGIIAIGVTQVIITAGIDLRDEVALPGESQTVGVNRIDVRLVGVIGPNLDIIQSSQMCCKQAADCSAANDTYPHLLLPNYAGPRTSPMNKSGKAFGRRP